MSNKDEKDTTLAELVKGVAEEAQRLTDLRVERLKSEIEDYEILIDRLKFIIDQYHRNYVPVANWMEMLEYEYGLIDRARLSIADRRSSFYETTKENNSNFTNM
jgi:hypothetical protein